MKKPILSLSLLCAMLVGCETNSENIEPTNTETTSIVSEEMNPELPRDIPGGGGQDDGDGGDGGD